jgi:uncharacterized protein
MEFKSKPLTDAEVDELDEILSQIGGRGAMNVEELDGFQCALICGPEIVHVGEYLPKIFGIDLKDAKVSPKEETLNRLLELLLRNWNSIICDLQSDGFHCPLLLVDGKGVARGNDWANGFMMGMDMRRGAWAKLVKREFEPLIPIVALAYENDPDRKVRPYKKPVGKRLRAELISGAAAGLKVMYERQVQRDTKPAPRPTTRSKEAPAKIGRNDPCYCGSGKKYKKCCGALRVN